MILVQEKTNIYFTVKLSLRKISYIVYAHELIMYICNNDAKIVRRKDAQCNTDVSPLK